MNGLRSGRAPVDSAKAETAPPRDGGMQAGVLLTDSELPAREARALLAHQLRVTREHLIARPEQYVSGVDARAFSALVRRRHSGEPLAYLTGEREFHGRTFAVTPAVLIPRPETELLVDAALRLGPRGPARVLDLGTGSGCIAITLALEHADWRVTATDASGNALEIARANAARLQADNVVFRSGDWFDALAAEARFDLIVANPPYVAPDDSHLDELSHEPRQALVAAEGGLACLRTIVDAAPSHVSKGGFLVFEHGYDQAAAVRKLFAARGWGDVHTRVDLAGHARVTSGCWNGAV